MDDKDKRLQAIADDIASHLPCDIDICNEATNLVPGEGDADADVVFVGEAPGASEDKQGRPFVGNAGRLLNGLLEEAGLQREDVFITNVVKTRPPKNRDPRTTEVRHYLPWLLAQLDVIEPKLVIPLGRHPLAHFAPGVKISEAHGRVLETETWRLFPMFHPAAALHNPSLRETLQEDARALRQAL